MGEDIQHFAYPHGEFSESVRNIVEESGFKTACSTDSGFNTAVTDPFVLRRIEVQGTDNVRKLRRKLKFGTNNSHWTYFLKYYSRPLKKFCKVSYRLNLLAREILPGRVYEAIRATAVKCKRHSPSREAM